MKQLADLTGFYALGNTHVTVHNSAAASILQEYDHAKRGSALCSRFIDELNSEDYIPADLVSGLYEWREKFEANCMNNKQQLASQVAQEPLDNFDREILAKMSEDSRNDLEDIVQSDQILQRAFAKRDEMIGKKGGRDEGDYRDNREEPNDNGGDEEIIDFDNILDDSGDEVGSDEGDRGNDNYEEW